MVYSNDMCFPGPGSSAASAEDSNNSTKPNEKGSLCDTQASGSEVWLQLVLLTCLALCTSDLLMLKLLPDMRPCVMLILARHQQSDCLADS